MKFGDREIFKFMNKFELKLPVVCKYHKTTWHKVRYLAANLDWFKIAPVYTDKYTIEYTTQHFH